MRNCAKNRKSGQISMEYLIIVGFITFAIISILAIALFYSSSVKDKIKMTQVNNFGNKVISAAESVFYAGAPSKTTINAYLPEGIEAIEISENNLIITIHISSGTNRIAFSSNVPIVNGETPLTISPGLKKLEIIAETEKVKIGMAS